MKTIPYEKFKHGQRVTCEIEGVKIDDAKISIDFDGTVSICQNISSYYHVQNTLGYKRSYRILYKDMDFNGNSHVSDIKLLARTLDDLEEGDVIMDDSGDEVMILGICSKMHFVSEINNFKFADGLGYTLDELKNDGYTLKQEEEKLEFREPTEEERKIINNPILKITADEQTIIYKGKTYIYEKP